MVIGLVLKLLMEIILVQVVNQLLFVLLLIQLLKTLLLVSLLELNNIVLGLHGQLIFLIVEMLLLVEVVQI